LLEILNPRIFYQNFKGKYAQVISEMYRLLWQIAIASAWEFEGLRIEPQRLGLDLGLPKNDSQSKQYAFSE